MDIRGKTALVTGGSRGLGRAAALALAEAGARAVALVARDEGRLQAVADEIKAKGVECMTVRADVRHDPEVQHAFETVQDAFGTIDLVVNNAGVGAHRAFHQLTQEEADFIIDVNLRGVMNVQRAAVAHMDGKGGIVVNVSSALGKIPLFGHSVYTASKAAVVSLSRVARKEVAPTGVRILCFCPGLIDTDFHDDRTEKFRHVPRWILRKPEPVARDLVRMIRSEKKESFGQFYLGIVYFFYRLLAW